MSRRFSSCEQIIRPKGIFACPSKINNCLECKYRLRMGKIGDDIWVDCAYYDMINDFLDNDENDEEVE